MSASFKIASSTSIGGRTTQEDRIVVVPDLNVHVPAGRRSALDPPTKRSFFAVFDGHGGQACSDFLSSRFHVELAENPLLESDPKAALLDVWDSMDGKFYETCNQKRSAERLAARANRTNESGKDKIDKQRVSATTIDEFKASFPVDGSTATVVLIVGTKLFVANCGDSAGVLVRKDGSVKTLTEDHGTLNPREVDRVKRSGGNIKEQVIPVGRRFPLCCLSHMAVVGKPRAYPGGLLVTRAFGNFYSKVAALGGTPGVIIADCERVLEMAVGHDWSEVVIASDGVWDVLPTFLVPQILAQLERTTGPGAGGSDEPSWQSEQVPSEEKVANGCHENDGQVAKRRLDQTCLNSKCARLVLSCVRHKHWREHQAVPDNTSVIILQFENTGIKAEAIRK